MTAKSGLTNASSAEGAGKLQAEPIPTLSINSPAPVLDAKLFAVFSDEQSVEQFGEAVAAMTVEVRNLVCNALRECKHQTVNALAGAVRERDNAFSLNPKPEAAQSWVNHYTQILAQCEALLERMALIGDEI